jgi:GAF domain-containing protein
LLEEFTGKLSPVLGFDRCALALLSDDGEAYQLRTLLETRPGKDYVAELAIPLARFIPGAVIRDREVRLITDPAAAREESQDPPDPAMWDGSLATVLAVPLLAYGKVLGALTFGTARNDAYDDEDVELAVSASALLGLALDRWRLSQELQLPREELARLSSFPELNPAAIVELDLDGRVHYMNPAAKERFP